MSDKDEKKKQQDEEARKQLAARFKSRDAMFAAIDEGRDEELEQEGVDVESMKEVQRDPTEEELKAKRAEAYHKHMEEDEEEEAQEDGYTNTDNPDKESGDSDEEQEQDVVDRKLYKLTVNGKEVEVTEQELLRRAQSGFAADEKFQEAARLRAEAEQVLKAKRPPEQDDVSTVEEDDRALARALQMGTEEEAARVIGKLKSRPPATDDTARLIDERLNFQRSAEAIQKEYPELFADDKMRQEFLEADQMFVRAGDKRSYADRYHDLAEYVMFRNGRQKKGATNDRLERKSKVTVIRRAGGRAMAESEREEDYDSFAANSVADLLATGHRRR